MISCQGALHEPASAVFSAPLRKEETGLNRQAQSADVTIAIDAMGGDNGPSTVIDGVAHAISRGLKAKIIFVGDKAVLAPLLSNHSKLAGADILHAEKAVEMTDKPIHILRRGHDTSMWRAVEAVKDGVADAVVSCGNTGVLMAVSKMQLKMIKGVDRPAVTALWPTKRGRTVVLDVGANVEADENQLVQFAIMGEAFFRALMGVKKPTVGLLNVGEEDLKGHELIRTAARVLRDADPDMAFKGFVEGNDISGGAVDVVVTDGFTGNIALKTAEGAARLVGGWVKETLTGTLNAKFGALLMRPGLKKLKDRIDPSSVNGGVFLGVNGLVVKSHGGSDARGVASAVNIAADLARAPFRDEVAQTVATVMARSNKMSDSDAEPVRQTNETMAAQ